jgi:nicotinate-nucleotide--dimethylbenzimidazole phosphoribosyltransferase
VGAGAVPLEPEHRRRPPIPIVPVDAGAAARAAARGLGPAAVWLAGVSGADPPSLHTRAVRGEDVRMSPAVRAGDPAAGPAMSVVETALAVDAGRDLAAAAAREGATVLVASGAGARAALMAAALTGVDAAGAAAPALAAHAGELDGPLRTLRRLGDGPLAALTGAALGAGEHGLGFACEGAGALAAAAIAAGIEPDLRARLIAVGDTGGPAGKALLAHLGVPRVAALGEP